MSWIVVGEEKGLIKLISKKPEESEIPGILPKGSFLTVQSKESKFILRVDQSLQYEPYQPSPLIIDMDLSGLYADTQCKNIVLAYRIKDISSRDDGKIDFIPPQSLARRSTQDEIDIAMSTQPSGPRVFLATVHAGQNQLLVDDKLNYITTRLPREMFYHQMQVCGKTGSGKTVAMKYLSQYFVEEEHGAVLAINVKDVDFLRMNQPSISGDPNVLREWENLGETPRGIHNCTVYYPANTSIESYQGVTQDICKRITLNVREIEPESLTGLLQNISEIGAQSFPDIFRYWKERELQDSDSFSDFVAYFQRGQNNRQFSTLNVRGDESTIPLHAGTFANILRNLNSAIEFFDNQDSISLDYEDILYRGKMSVINVSGEKGIQFGSILLRHLLKRIVFAKSHLLSDVPILVIIDEVHQFYNSEASLDALGDLDTICRTGRSQKIGVIFASQNENDIPKGLSSVINSKIFFKSDISGRGLYGVLKEEIQTLKAGFAVANIHDLSQLRIIKFPLAYSGVIE